MGEGEAERESQMRLRERTRGRGCRMERPAWSGAFWALVGCVGCRRFGLRWYTMARSGGCNFGSTVVRFGWS
jgi:hypothetical protein